MCRVREVPRSGLYEWHLRPLSPGAQQTQRLDAAMQALFARHHRRPGSPKMTQLLRGEGWTVSQKRVAQRMRALGLRSIIRRSFRVTTDSNHAFPVASDQVQRAFSVDRPDLVWVSDITCLRTRSGWLYLPLFLDL